MTITAWYMDEDTESDQRLPHVRSGEDSEVSMDLLDQLGVLRWSGIAGPDDPKLTVIREERGYTYFDIIEVCPDKLPNYEDKIKSFYKEHIHYDEEIRFCVEGFGYFDLRDAFDRWIRVSVEKGDMIILPEGMYHRFTCTSTDYIKAMRLFVGEPIWTPYNREEIEEAKNASRLKYVSTFLSQFYTEENPAPIKDSEVTGVNEPTPISDNVSVGEQATATDGDAEDVASPSKVRRLNADTEASSPSTKE